MFRISEESRVGKKKLLRVTTGVTPGIRNTFQTVKMQKKNILLVIGIIVEMI